LFEAAESEAVPEYLAFNSSYFLSFGSEFTFLYLVELDLIASLPSLPFAIDLAVDLSSYSGYAIIIVRFIDTPFATAASMIQALISQRGDFESNLFLDVRFVTKNMVALPFTQLTTGLQSTTGSQSTTGLQSTVGTTGLLQTTELEEPTEDSEDTETKDEPENQASGLPASLKVVAALLLLFLVIVF
jgi:hypothetical protein